MGEQVHKEETKTACNKLKVGSSEWGARGCFLGGCNLPTGLPSWAFDGTDASKSPIVSLMLCCHFEILNNF